MAVVIDEVHIEPAAQPSNRGGDASGGGDGGEAKQKPPAPEEIARAIEIQHERYERLRAY